MPNISHTGFRWKFSQHSPGSAPPIVIKHVADNYATKLCRGVPVKMDTDGSVLIATAGDAIYGILDGVEQYYEAGAVRGGAALPANTVWGTNISRQSRVRVIPVRGQVFEVRVDENTTATTLGAYQAFIGENVEWAAGTNVNDEAGAVVDISGHATTNSLSVRIEDVPSKETQDFTSTGVVLHVTFNLIQDTASGSTTGI